MTGKKSTTKVSPSRIKIFDTTLRDGEQCPGASLNGEEKLEIAKQLARLNVDVIEAGFAISSPEDFRAINEVATQVEGPTICSLARARKEDIEAAAMALKPAKHKRIHTFIATSPIHMEYKLKKTPIEVKKIAVEMVQYAKKFSNDVEFSAEDAGRSIPEFLYEIFEAVIEAGATVINVPDTVGYTIPHHFGELIANIRKQVRNINGVDISVHCHNDLGLATANSLFAILNGATQVECTINGIGERAGNASLEEIVMTLATRHDVFGISTNIKTEEIYKTSRLVSNLTGLLVQPNKAIIGGNAFAHEAGIHQDGVLKYRSTYEIMNGKSIGLGEGKLVLGKHSGRHAFVKRLEELGYQLNSDEVNKAFTRFKELADKKKTVSDRDLEALVADEVYTTPETYRLEYIQATAGNTTQPSAIVKLNYHGETLQGAELGTGPVDAVYQAIKKLTKVGPKLVDYTLQAITGGTDAVAEVVLRIEADGKIYTGRGSDTDVIVSSARGFLNAINKLVYDRETTKASSGKGKHSAKVAREAASEATSI